MADVRDGVPFGSRSAGILLVVALPLSAAPVRAESRPGGAFGVAVRAPSVVIRAPAR